MRAQKIYFQAIKEKEAGEAGKAGENGEAGKTGNTSKASQPNRGLKRKGLSTKGDIVIEGNSLRSLLICFNFTRKGPSRSLI